MDESLETLDGKLVDARRFMKYARTKTERNYWFRQARIYVKELDALRARKEKENG